MLNGRMMDMPLLISSIIDYAADVRSSSEIVSQTVEGNIHRYTYADSHRRTSQLANALKKLGVNEKVVKTSKISRHYCYYCLLQSISLSLAHFVA